MDQDEHHRPDVQALVDTALAVASQRHDGIVDLGCRIEALKTAIEVPPSQEWMQVLPSDVIWSDTCVAHVHFY
ncbi:hypothetical protein EJB05_27690, partial [Eragrostis curvula]